MKNLKAYIAEAIGTCALTLVACGVAAFTGGDLVATSLAFGLVIVAMAYSIGNVSGCHINPAVSFAMLISKKIDFKQFIGYVISQFVGALVGSLLLALFTHQFDTLGGNEVSWILTNGYGDFGGQVIGLIVEVVLTFIFVIAILGVTSKEENSNIAGLVIGGALTLVHLLGINLTGTSVNPARSFAPALLQAFAGQTDAIAQYWLCLIGPMAGAALAAIVYACITKKDQEQQPEAKEETAEEA